MIRSRVRVGTAVLAVLLVAGCGQNAVAPEPDPGLSGESISAPSGSAAPSTSQGSPRTGSTNTSQPVGPGPDDPVDNPSVSLPGLPIGGAGEVLDLDSGLQCVDANWRGDAGTPADLSDGITVAVTNITFTPAVFEVTSAACPSGVPSCQGFTFTSTARACGLAVVPNGVASDPNIAHTLVLDGVATFSGVEEQRREGFLVAAAAVPGAGASLQPPPTLPSTTTESPSPSEPESSVESPTERPSSTDTPSGSAVSDAP